MPPLFDTHAHLDDEQFHDLPAVLDRARAAGLVGIIAIATTAQGSRASLDLAGHSPGLLRASVGIHPNEAGAAAAGDWDEVVRLAAHPLAAAIGETGLDRHWDTTPFAAQQEWFARHLELARKRGLPIVIHCREAEADVLRMLRDDFERHGPLRGVMHSFAGSLAMARDCLAMGLHVSFAGMLTFRNAQPLRDVAREVPLDRLLIETDAPYLAPVPLRGQRNEPARVVHTATCLAGLLGLDLEQLAEATTRNARLLFAM